MLVIKFKDFFDSINKNHQLPATTSTKIFISDKEKIDIKIGTNTNKFILNLENENDLIDLFCLNFNSMTDSFITPLNLNISSQKIAKVAESIICALDGVSTHLVKFPEASRAAGQVFKKNSDIVVNIFAVDSTMEYDGKEKIYAQNATTMKFARPFSSDFKFDGKIISYLDIFSDLHNFPIFEKFSQQLFGNFLLTLVEKVKSINSGIVDVAHENTIINIPVSGQYISTSPISSAKILNALQYSKYSSDGYKIKNLYLSVGGANPQNAADYLSNIGGRQRLLVSVPPKITVTNQEAKKHLYKFNYGFEKSLLSSVSFIEDSLKDLEYSNHINNILRLAYEEKIESFENNILEKSLFIDNLIAYKIKDLNYVIDNYYFMLNKVNIESVKYNANLIHLVNSKNKLIKFLDESDVNIKFNDFISNYEKNTPNDLKNIENCIINDVKSSIEYDFAKHAQCDNKLFEAGFSKLLNKRIKTILFGVT